MSSRVMLDGSISFRGVTREVDGSGFALFGHEDQSDADRRPFRT